MNLIIMRRIIGLAALLGSILMVACGLHSTTAPTETFTVYEDAPTLKLLDLGPPGNSPGDVYRFLLRYTLLPAVQSQAKCLARRR